MHIADVAAHVPEGSPLDREARRRSTSVYAPGAVEPMLPHALSSGACSLVPGAGRAAVTVEMELHGAVLARAAFHRSLIRSDARLDYEQVDRIFAGAESAAEPWGASLRAARQAAAALERERERSGALVVDSEEPEFSFDEHGNVLDVLARAQTESHRLIEHLMIAANEAVAGLLERRGVPCLYRVHERPDPERVQRLADQLASLDVPTPALPEHMSSTQAAELLGEMSRRVDAHVRSTGHGRQALSSLVLRSLKQAVLLARQHRARRAALRRLLPLHLAHPPLPRHRLPPRAAVSRRRPRGRAARRRARRAGRVDVRTRARRHDRRARLRRRRALLPLERLLYEHGHQQVFAGEITGLISAGAFVAFGLPAGEAGEAGEEEGAGPQFEGMLPVRLLRAPAPARASATGDARRRSREGGRQRRDGGRDAGGEPDGAREWWELNEEGTILHGERTGATLRLGDAVEVRVARVDSIRGRVDLEPAP